MTQQRELQSFRDRRHAGEVLAGCLGAYREAAATVVLALPRGGIVPAAVIADALGLPLDVLISRKLRAPDNPELAIGAVAEGGKPFFYRETLDATGASRDYVDAEVAAQRSEIEHRQRLFRGGRALRLPPGATVILVDDGIATGSTVIAALAALREQRARRIVLAAPVAPPDTVERLREMADEIVIPLVPPWFGAVGAFYRNFSQVSDEEVCELLARASRRVDGAAQRGERRPRSSDTTLEVAIPMGSSQLRGTLDIPAGASGLVVFAHGSGSGRHSPRNRLVAGRMHDAQLATLLVDLLTEHEAARDERTAEHRFDIDLLSERVGVITAWLIGNADTRDLAIGYYGASTGAAAALVAAAANPREVHAVVSRGGRPDLAGNALPHVLAPTLLIVGGDDHQVLELNREALGALQCIKRLEVVPGATHLFEEPGTLETVSRLACEWFTEHLQAARVASRAAG